MSTPLPFPSFAETLPFLDQFILELVDAYQARKIKSWGKLDKRVRRFFTSKRMEQMEKLIPGWKKMSSYSKGITRTHVNCVFLGIFMMPEFKALTPAEQDIAKWVVLFHDLDKSHIQGEKDTMHAFHSGILAARILPTLGFPIIEKYHELFDSWSELTHNAYIQFPDDAAPAPDNKKLPEILKGIEQLFGENSPASLITKTVLLHISLDVDPFYPTPAPLTDAETKDYIAPELFPLLKVMMLGDNAGWSLFDPKTHKRQTKDASKAFEKVQRLIDNNNKTQ